MTPEAQAAYDEIQERTRKARISELAGFDAETLAEYAFDLETMRYNANDRIESLEDENAELRAKLNNKDDAVPEISSTVAYLSELVNLFEEDSRRAELVGRAPDERLRSEIADETNKLIELVCQLIPEDVTCATGSH
ncbi:hypothetical protein JF714_15560 [Mycobacterium avium]|uniref:hypothetical protein n=1 Tax=Mycobacterium avium TaxID=1764 RepID=UPI001CDAD165|nr:hypothetical protein [Mycobacterium avium]MCA2331859.1 hypothetical protein [Mycobacterium avium]